MYTINGAEHSELLGFSILSIVRYSKNYRTQCFGNWICFLPQIRRKTSTLLSSLEKANLNYWSTNVSINAAEYRLCRREIRGKYGITIMIKHAHASNKDRRGGKILCNKPSQQTKSMKIST
jgi:hypothetical protein